MRYKVEYLLDEANANSACHVRYVYVEELPHAREKALEDAAFAHRWRGATAFQIRDLYDEDRIVAAEAFQVAKQPTVKSE